MLSFAHCLMACSQWSELDYANVRRSIFTADEVSFVNQITQLPTELYYLESHGKIYKTVEEIGPGKLIQIHFRCLGGKGGFGSILRSFRIHRSTNQLMCRNLNGRRLADVKEEERLKKWIEKKADREKAKELKAKEKYERLKQGGPKHQFSDQKYLQNRDRILDQTEDAVEAGMKAMQEKQMDEENPAPNPIQDSSASEASTSSESDFDWYDAVPLPSSSKARKRKHRNDGDDVPTKKEKVEYASDVIYEYFTEKIIENICENAIVEDVKKRSLTSNQLQEIQNTEKVDVANEVEEVSKKQLVPKVYIDYPAIDLDTVEHVEDLVGLGLITSNMLWNLVVLS
uniref:Sde2 N-terminal ubiquitin domain-containing protein n=1 Tax=Ditylenchus dipsaci TaxID=166011 RepID=A0A915D124_9BILA